MFLEPVKFLSVLSSGPAPDGCVYFSESNKEKDFDMTITASIVC